jgi:hypothetical protein
MKITKYALVAMNKGIIEMVISGHFYKSEAELALLNCINGDDRDDPYQSLEYTILEKNVTIS